MEGFTPTSVDGVAIEQPTTDTPIETPTTHENDNQANENVQQQDDGQQEHAVDERIDDGRNAENDANGQHGNAQEKDVVTQEGLPQEELSFGADSFELDPVKAEAPAPVATPEQAAPDLLSFINENAGLIDEFQSLNRDFDALDPKDLVEAHLKSSYPDLTGDDIGVLLDDYSYDEDSDDAATIVKKKIAFQKAVSEAKTVLSNRKDQLTQELASRNLGGPTQADLQVQEQQHAAKEAFQTGTQNFFTQNFEGFEFKVGDNQGLRVKVNNAEAVQTQQSDINNLLGTFFDDGGTLTNPKGYHTAIAIASNPDKFMEFAYQKGKADQATAEAKSSKNIDMTGRPAQQDNTAAPKWRLVD